MTENCGAHVIAEALAWDRADDPRARTTARAALDLATAIRAQDARRRRAAKLFGKERA